MNNRNALIIKGTINSSFLQQDTYNSSQNGYYSFDYDAVYRLFQDIKKWSDAKELESMREQINNLVSEGVKLTKERKNPEKIKLILTELGDVVKNISSGIIASGIYSKIREILGEI